MRLTLYYREGLKPPPSRWDEVEPRPNYIGLAVVKLLLLFDLPPTPSEGGGDGLGIIFRRALPYAGVCRAFSPYGNYFIILIKHQTLIINH
jgi:hypothetical protein